VIFDDQEAVKRVRSLLLAIGEDVANVDTLASLLEEQAKALRRRLTRDRERHASQVC